MGIATFPAASAGGIKSVQRGSAAGAGSVTITAVDISKSFVNIFGTTSSGTVSASFSLSAAANSNVTLVGPAAGFPNNNLPGGSNYAGVPNSSTVNTGSQTIQSSEAKQWERTQGVNAPNYSVSGGSNNLVAAVVQGYLSNSTTLVVSGACRWEVVEFN